MFVNLFAYCIYQNKILVLLNVDTLSQFQGHRSTVPIFRKLPLDITKDFPKQFIKTYQYVLFFPYPRFHVMTL